MAASPVFSTSELIDAISAKVDLPKAKVKDVIEALVEVSADKLRNGDQVRVHNFGTFKRTTLAARTGRNPKTKEPIQIAASSTVKFKVASPLKSAL